MFNINFSLSNPFSHRFESAYNRLFQLSKNKFAEVEIVKDNGIISFGLRLTARQSHAGVYIGFGLLGWDFSVDVYDHRHWLRDENKWQDS
jgi:hypothetical protein